MKIFEDFFDSVDIDVNIDDGNSSQEEYNFVLTCLYFKKSFDPKIASKVFKMLGTIGIETNDEFKIILSKKETSTNKATISFNSDITNIDQVKSFLLFIYKLFGYDETLSICITDTKKDAIYRFDCFSRLFELETNFETSSTFNINDSILLDDFRVICQVLIRHQIERCIISAYIEMPHGSYIDSAVKTKLLYNYKNYLIPLHIQKKYLKMKHKVLNEIINSIKDKFDVYLYLKTNDIYIPNSTKIQTFEIKDKSLIDVIKTLPNNEAYFIKTYRYIQAASIEYYYCKKTFNAALTFSLFNTRNETLLFEYGLIIKYDVYHDKYTKLPQEGDIKPAYQLRTKIINSSK